MGVKEKGCLSLRRIFVSGLSRPEISEYCFNYINRNLANMGTEGHNLILLLITSTYMVYLLSTPIWNTNEMPLNVQGC